MPRRSFDPRHFIAAVRERSQDPHRAEPVLALLEPLLVALAGNDYHPGLATDLTTEQTLEYLSAVIGEPVTSASMYSLSQPVQIPAWISQEAADLILGAHDWTVALNESIAEPFAIEFNRRAPWRRSIIPRKRSTWIHTELRALDVKRNADRLIGTTTRVALMVQDTLAASIRIAATVAVDDLRGETLHRTVSLLKLLRVMVPLGTQKDPEQSRICLVA